ncbi:MAG: tetratricopeptide repeat protein [Chlorobiaceae bacterium]
MLILISALLALLSAAVFYRVNHSDPLPEIMGKAEKGDADAQYNLGLAYKKGEGVKQDYAAALKWLKLAAVQKNAKAAYILGEMYQDGKGVKQDYEMAVKWFEEACDNGSSDGCKIYQHMRSVGY